MNQDRKGEEETLMQLSTTVVRLADAPGHPGLVRHAAHLLGMKWESATSQHGFESAEIVLREENAPAVALYSKLGFKAKSTKVSLAASA